MKNHKNPRFPSNTAKITIKRLLQNQPLTAFNYDKVSYKADKLIPLSFATKF